MCLSVKLWACMAQGTIDYILVAIHITIWIQNFFKIFVIYYWKLFKQYTFSHYLSIDFYYKLRCFDSVHWICKKWISQYRFKLRQVYFWEPADLAYSMQADVFGLTCLIHNCCAVHVTDPSGCLSTAAHAVVLILMREHYYCVYLYMLCRLMYWHMLLIYTKQLPVSGIWVHDV